MAKKKKSVKGSTAYSFPTRNPKYPNDRDIVYTDGFAPTNPECKVMYERAQSDDAKKWRFQYVGIEEELERSMRYVDPCDENAAVFSLKFAEIIRAAANAYEIMARDLYARFYNGKDKIDIHDYLALEKHLDFAKQTVTHFAAQGSFPSHPEVCQPFVRVASWDKASAISSAHIPCWWTGYNKIKHTNDGLKDHATLANALASTAALFLLIERVFGFGVLQGGFYEMPSSGGATMIRNHPRWAGLFIRI
jgi:hypothetical protein